MNAARVCFLVAVLAGIALVAVHLRLEQTRRAAAVLTLESRQVALRREWWGLQARVARLRAPARIRDRLENLRTGLIAPKDRSAYAAPARLIAGRSQ